MKILLLNYEFPPLGGGAGKATYNIAKELSRLGHDIDVLTSRMKGQKTEEQIEGFRVHRVSSWRKSIHDCGFLGALTFVFFAYFKFSQLTNNNHYDVIHYFFGLPTGFLSLLPGTHKTTPYIVSLRGSDVPLYDAYNKNLQYTHKILKPFTTYIWKKAKKVVAVTKSLKITALKTAPAQDIIVIPNGVEMDSFKPVEKTKRPDDTLRLLSVTRLIERKGVEHILQALAELKDQNITLLVVGTGNYENNLKHICEDLLLNDLVTFYGYCPREKLSALYSQSDVFVLPSLAEAFGNVFAEAMAYGLPIIGTRIGGIIDLVDDENGILVEPGNVEEIKQAIMTMKHSPDIRTRMKKTNRKKIVENYKWETVAQQYLALYTGEKASQRGIR